MTFLSPAGVSADVCRSETHGEEVVEECQEPPGDVHGDHHREEHSAATKELPGQPAAKHAVQSLHIACCQTFSGAACPWMVWMRHDRTDAKGQRSHCSKKGLCAFNLCVLSLTCDAVPHLPGGVCMADAPSFWCSCQALLLVQQLSCILHTVTTGLETRLIAICPIGGSISCTIPCEGAHVDPRAG